VNVCRNVELRVCRITVLEDVLWCTRGCVMVPSYEWKDPTCVGDSAIQLKTHSQVWMLKTRVRPDVIRAPSGDVIVSQSVACATKRQLSVRLSDAPSLSWFYRWKIGSSFVSVAARDLDSTLNEYTRISNGSCFSSPSAYSFVPRFVHEWQTI
jgi:hypothetical protein